MQVKRLSEEDREALQEAISGRYLHGDCYSFAIALHRRTGWQLVGAVDREGLALHAGVRRPDGVYLDVRGFMGEYWFLDGWTQAVGIAEMSEADLLAVDSKQMDERIAKADVHIDRLFPDLPGSDEAGKRIGAFLQGLHALCREHGFYIRAQTPGMRPVIYSAHGDEAGFCADELCIGGWAFDRLLSDTSEAR